MEGDYLVEATFLRLWIVLNATTLERRWKGSAWDASGQDSILAALLGMRNVESLSAG